MRPPSISASAVRTFTSCAARYKAEWIDRVPDLSGSAANLGTTCHSALEDWVTQGLLDQPVEVLEKLFTHHYRTNFINDDRLEEGLEMMRNWHQQQDWDGIEILSAEKKQSFELPTSVGMMPFTFIFDRLDRHDDGTIWVHDYKSNMVAKSSDDLRTDIQAQAYGVAVRLMFPEAPAIYVVFDFLRYDAIGIRFTKAENRHAWEFLKATAEQIIASDGTEETLNDECRWCVRRHDCKTLQSHIDGGGKFTITGVDAALEKRSKLAYAKKAMEAMISDLDEFLLGQMEHDGITELENDQVRVFIGSSKRRGADGPIIAKIVGPGIYAKYSNITMKNLELLIKNEDLESDEVTAIQNAIRMKFGQPGLRVKQKSALDEADE